MCNRPIVHVCVTDSFSGTERVILELSRHAVQAGHPVAAIVPAIQALDPFENALKDAGATVRRLGAVYDRNRNYLKSFTGFVGALRELEPALVHFHVPWVPCGWEAILAARAAGVQCVLRTEHNPVPDPLSQLQRAKLRIVDLAASHVVFVSRGTSDSHLSNGRTWLRNWSVIPNGIPFKLTDSIDRRAVVRARLGLPSDALIAVMVGSLVVRKGPIDFVRSAARAIAQDSQLHFLVLGQGPLREPGERLARELGVAGRVRFLGHRSDVHELLEAADIYVQPSHYEGLSIAMLEALAAGLPMVSTRVEGLEEVLVDGRGAYVCDVGDIEGVARGLVTLERNPALRKELSTLLRDRTIREFSSTAMYAHYEALYRGLGALN